MFALEVVSALLLLLNKIFVRKKKTIGWVFGMFGTVMVTIYFYLQMVLENRGNLWIMVVYDVALFFLMIYGYLVSSSVKNPPRVAFLKKWNVVFKLIVVSITTVVCLIFLIQAITADLVFVQFLGALGGLIGTLLLAFHKSLTNKVGWMCYLFANLLIAYLMFEKDSMFFSVCQIISAGISVLALKDEIEKVSKIETAAR